MVTNGTRTRNPHRHMAPSARWSGLCLALTQLPTPPLVLSTLGGRQPVARRVPASAHLPMHVPAEASGQALSPQDQVALVTKAIQQDVVLLVLSVSAVVHKGHYVSLK